MSNAQNNGFFFFSVYQRTIMEDEDILGIDIGSFNIVGYVWRSDPTSHEASNYTVLATDLGKRLFE